MTFCFSYFPHLSFFSGRCNKLLAKNSQQCWLKGFIFRVQIRVEISFVISVLALKLVELPDSWIGDSSLGMKIHGKNKQCPYFSENWPGTQSKGQYTRASWLKGGFSLVNELEITLPDFTVLPSVDTGGNPFILECVSQAYSTLTHFALLILNRVSLLSSGRISGNLVIYKNTLCWHYSDPNSTQFS